LLGGGPIITASGQNMSGGKVPIEYVVPLRWSDDAGLDEFTDYLTTLASSVAVTVVDGSEPALYARHGAAWSGIARQLPVADWPGRNRKVAGVVTGVFAARHEFVIIADDDVRYRLDQLADLQFRLAGADLVRPQNVFDPLPWHARWDTARMLINRAFGSDYPGTLGIRKSALERAGGYDGDVLFENLQLIRTITAVGGRVVRADDLFITRLPPTTGGFIEQRVRQAYDDFAQPGRLIWEASWLPVLLIAVVFRRRAALLTLLTVPVAVAEVGRRRHRGRIAFPPTSAGWAPLWVVERAVAVWLAIGQRIRGGARYRGARLPTAATRVAPPDQPAAPLRVGRRPTPWLTGAH
jgi:hypothetical protein